MKPAFLSLLALLLLAVSCKKETATTPAKLIFKFRFDSTQARLNNLGQPAIMPAGNAGQNPRFNQMSAHYIELAPTAFTGLGKGAVLYRAPETRAGGTNAIDFSKATLAGNNEVFFTANLKEVPPGVYQWLRVSLAYQNFDVNFLVDTVVNGVALKGLQTGTLAGFIGFNTFIENYRLKQKTLQVGANKKQGYWGFESALTLNGQTHLFTSTGQAPEGATTVVNPIFATSPIPQGSCVVTAAFKEGNLTVTGAETKDILVEVVLSTNKSFEWKEVVPDGFWQPTKGEQVVDMGIRGMVPQVR